METRIKNELKQGRQQYGQYIGLEYRTKIPSKCKYKIKFLKEARFNLQPGDWFLVEVRERPTPPQTETYPLLPKRSKDQISPPGSCNSADCVVSNDIVLCHQTSPLYQVSPLSSTILGVGLDGHGAHAYFCVTSVSPPGCERCDITRT